MTQIRIDTEHTREVGRRLITEADRMAEIGRELQNAIGNLDTGAWDGRSRARAEPLLGRVRPESERVKHQLEELGYKLVRVANIFEQEDDTAARNVDGMGWVEFGVSAITTGAIAGAGSVFESVTNNDLDWQDIKSDIELLKDAGEITFEQFTAWMNSIGIVDEYVIEIFYYQDDAVEILSISEEWTQWLVKTPIPVKSGWNVFQNSLRDGLGLGSTANMGLLGKVWKRLPLIGLAIDMGFTTGEYSGQGLFSNPEYYAALTTDVLMFAGGALLMAGVASIGLVGAPAVIATVVASVGWAFVSEWLEDPIEEWMTPGFQWMGEQLDTAWDGAQDVAGDVAEWTSDAVDWTENAVDEAADWVSDQAGNLVDSLIPNWGW